MRVRQIDLLRQKRYYYPLLKKGFFIHPTDMMYAIGCDATNNNLVLKLRLLKRWHDKPFNIIAPSIEWIREHIDVPEEALKHLPGPVTIIAHLKTNALAPDVHLGTKVVGVRFPKHWITNIVSEMGVPIVTTCANKKAQKLMTNLENGHPELLGACALIISEGEKTGEEPLFINYTEGEYLTL